MGDLTNLWSLSLGKNRFTSVPEVIAGLHLRWLYLRDNQLTSLPKWLSIFLSDDEFVGLDLDFDLLSLIPLELYKEHIIASIPDFGICIRDDLIELPETFELRSEASSLV
jgi:Leucine-rich repeat (LRR) protein